MVNLLFAEAVALKDFALCQRIRSMADANSFDDDRIAMIVTNRPLLYIFGIFDGIAMENPN